MYRQVGGSNPLLATKKIQGELADKTSVFVSFFILQKKEVIK